MNFRSDNVYAVHETIMEAIAAANHGPADSYGADDWTARALAALNEVFERKVEAFLMTSGTAANALGLSAAVPPYGAILCHADAHILVDEAGAPEFYTGGAKLFGISSPSGKLSQQALERRLAQFVRGEHDPKPKALSITQATELGTVYSIDEIGALAEVAKSNGLSVHMDGARFANALVSLGCSPADMTWRAGVDVMSFGATKNGALACEAVIFFNTRLAEDFAHRRMRAGQLLAKGRFLGAQMEAYLRDGLWLKTARHANDKAVELFNAFSACADLRIPLGCDANSVFPIMPASLKKELDAKGALFHPWPGEGPGTDTIGQDEVFVRFVTSFQTTSESIANVAGLLPVRNSAAGCCPVDAD